MLVLVLAATGCAPRATTWEVSLIREDDTATPAFRFREDRACEIAARSLQRRDRQDLPQMTATYECRELR
jgi:hypothetical protein